MTEPRDRTHVPSPRAHAAHSAWPRLRGTIGLIAFAALFAAACAARLLVGRDGEGVIFGPPPDSAIVTLRLTAAISSVIAGAGLGVSGLLLQSLLRNPLASPFILGLSSGAGLGMTAATWAAATWPVFGFLLAGGALLPASIGAIASLAAVVAIGRRHGVLEPLTLVLAGVIVSAFASAVTLLIQHLLPFETRGQISAWMLGTIPEVSIGFLPWVTGAATLAGVILAVRFGRAMDVAALSDAEAISVGLDLPKLRLWLLVVAAILAASATALCGPLAFIGLVAPHAARMLCGPSHRVLVFGAAAGGTILLLLADSLRQAIDFGAGRLPIGVVTAILGSLAFLWLLRRYQPIAP